jgi:hypothetical protein
LEGKGGEVLKYYEDANFGPPNLSSEGARVQQNWLYSFFSKVPSIRPWLNIHMPSFGFEGEQKNTLIAYFRGLEKLQPKIEETPLLAMSEVEKKLAKSSINTSQCFKCHKAPPYPKDMDMTSVAPSLQLVKERIRYDWVVPWLKDPAKLIYGTRMPGLYYSEGQAFYPDSDAQMNAVRDWLFAAPNVYNTK